jgi:hypothetical protein
MKSMVAIIVALGLAIAFSPMIAAAKDVNYKAATSKAECEGLPDGKWDDSTKTCSKGR